MNNNETTLLVGPYPPPFGGVSSHLFELNNSFKNTRYKPCILQFDSKTEDIITDEITIFKRDTSAKFSFLKIFFRQPIKVLISILFLLMQAIKSPKLYIGSFLKALHVIEITDYKKLDRVVVYTTRIGALIPFVKLLRPNLKLYYCIYADPFKNPNFYKKHKYWYRKAVEKCDKVFSSSCYCSSSYGNFTKSVNPHVIYVGVDLERFHVMDSALARKKLSLTERPTILFLGRMEPEMGADNALKIAKTILSKKGDINFIIAGAEGSLTKSIFDAVSEFDGRLIVKSNLPKDDIPYYYGACTISIAPTLGLHACMGVSIKEAMASGRPTIASDSGGIPEAIRNNIDGLVVPLKDGNIDNDEFSNLILNLLSDEEKIKEFSNNARIRCEEIFSVNATAEKYLKLFEDN